MYRGELQNDLGETVDILENVPKTLGIKMMIRSMAPDVIVADEIGGKRDSDIINVAFCSGVKGIFTAHGDSIESIYKNQEIKELIDSYCLDRIIILSSINKGEISRVYKKDNKKYI